MSEKFVPFKGPSMDDLIRPRAKNKKKARTFEPDLIHVFAHTAMGLLCDADDIKSGRHTSAEKKAVDEATATAVGKLISLIPPIYRKQLWRALDESQGWHSFEECLAEWNDVRRAYERAKAALDGNGNPKFKDVWQKYQGGSGEKALRRNLKKFRQVMPLSPDKRGRRKKRRPPKQGLLMTQDQRTAPRAGHTLTA
jgi:hypothetical protein